MLDLASKARVELLQECVVRAALEYTGEPWYIVMDMRTKKPKLSTDPDDEYSEQLVTAYFMFDDFIEELDVEQKAGKTVLDLAYAYFRPRRSSFRNMMDGMAAGEYY